MYTTKSTSMDEIFGDFWNLPLPQQNKFDIKTDDSGSKLYINAVGHSPESISIETTRNLINIKSNSLDTLSFVNNLDLSFKITDAFDRNSVKAKFKNGVIEIKINYSKEGKLKKVKLEV